MRNLQDLTDEELALLYVEGNNRAFDVLLSRNEVKLFTYIMFFVRDQEVANDIFQETFLKVVSKLQNHEYSVNGKFGGWLLRIAHNVMMDMYRGQRYKYVVESKDDNDLSNISGEDLLETNAEVNLINIQILSDVRKMMEQLPVLQREVVYMRYYQQLTFKEIAEATGVSINTSLGRMRYALLNLRRMAKKHDVYLQLD